MAGSTQGWREKNFASFNQTCPSLMPSVVHNPCRGMLYKSPACQAWLLPGLGCLFFNPLNQSNTPAPLTEATSAFSLTTCKYQAFKTWIFMTPFSPPDLLLRKKQGKARQKSQPKLFYTSKHRDFLLSGASFNMGINVVVS